jgi:hypothetical protein
MKLPAAGRIERLAEAVDFSGPVQASIGKDRSKPNSQAIRIGSRA